MFSAVNVKLECCDPDPVGICVVFLCKTLYPHSVFLHPELILTEVFISLV